MHRHRSLRKLKTFLLLLITLHVVVHTVIFTSQSPEPFKEQISLTCSVIAEEDGAEQNSGDFKPPKHSFIDYATYFSAGSMTPVYLPHEGRFSFAAPFVIPQKVYLDIFAPPQNLA